MSIGHPKSKPYYGEICTTLHPHQDLADCESNLFLTLKYCNSSWDDHLVKLFQAISYASDEMTLNTTLGYRLQEAICHGFQVKSTYIECLYKLGEALAKLKGMFPNRGSSKIRQKRFVGKGLAKVVSKLIVGGAKSRKASGVIVPGMPAVSAAAPSALFARTAAASGAGAAVVGGSVAAGAGVALATYGTAGSTQAGRDAIRPNTKEGSLQGCVHKPHHRAGLTEQSYEPTEPLGRLARAAQLVSEEKLAPVGFRKWKRELGFHRVFRVHVADKVAAVIESSSVSGRAEGEPSQACQDRIWKEVSFERLQPQDYHCGLLLPRRFGESSI